MGGLGSERARQRSAPRGVRTRVIGGLMSVRLPVTGRGDTMSEVPEGLYYTKEHEWMRVEGDTVTIGITDHAQDMLTDIVYIELPGEGDTVGDMGEFAVVESVKSASPIFAPLAGTITAVNMDLEDAPELMNTSPYGDGWIVKMTLENPEAVAGLMDAAAYKAEIGE